MQGNIKMQRPHPKQGHNRMLSDQPETRMAEMVCLGRAEEEFGEGMQNKQQTGLASFYKSLAFTPSDTFAQNSDIISIT